jgi:hypothetical protein
VNTARFRELPDRLLLGGGHGQDQVGLGQEMTMAVQVGRGERVLRQLDPDLPEHEARVEGR